MTDLVDLNRLGVEAKSNYKSNYIYSELSLNDSFCNKFKKLYEIRHKDSVMVLGSYGGFVTTSTGNTIDFSYSMFGRTSYFLDFAKAYKEYSHIVNDVITEGDNEKNLLRELGETKRLDLQTRLYKEISKFEPDFTISIESILAYWKNNISENSVYDFFIQPIHNLVKHKSEDEIKNMFRFISNNKWSHTGKSPIRYDGVGSAVMSLMEVVNAKQGFIEDIVNIIASNDELISGLIIKSEQQVLTKYATGIMGDNIIYYGAPGTGKSHTIDNEINESTTIRTVFHADTQNSDFMGCLKPIMDGSSIKYEFRPGPFTNAVINAVNDPEHHHWLVIEEINRAPAAAVFGEIFQLLDREPTNGESRYSITLIDPDMQSFITSKSAAAIENGKLKIPGNLTLLATMNSSDQAVMPLDTAFKRRWKFRYIPLDFYMSYNNIGKPCADGNLLITDQGGVEVKISWRNFAIAINTILTSSGIPEDRHLGPFFLSDNEVNGADSKDALTGKLFMYLWDDVLRHGMTGAVFNAEIKTYGQLTRRYDNHEPVFNDTFYDLIEEQMEVVAMSASEQNDSELLHAVAEEEPVYASE